MKSSKLVRGLLMAGLASAAGTASAQQTTIDFNDITGSGLYGKANIAGGCDAAGACYQSGNFVVGAVVSGNFDTHVHNPPGEVIGELPNGDPIFDFELETVDDSNGVYIRTADGSAFSFNSFDIDSTISNKNRDRQGNGLPSKPNAFWEVIGFNTSHNNGLDTFDWGTSSLTAAGISTPPTKLSSYGSVVSGAYQAVDNGTTGTVNLTGFDNVNAVWIHYGNHPANQIDGSAFTAYLDNFVVTAAPVPVPAAVYLFGTGLMGFLAIGKRRRSI